MLSYFVAMAYEIQLIFYRVYMKPRVARPKTF
jgi:hypothetical protein